MTARRLPLAFVAALALLGGAAPLAAQTPEIAIVDASTTVLSEIMSIPVRSIPQGLLSNAQGIAILPGMIKGGFIIGLRHGRGVVVIRDENNHWQSPLFIEITGASVGWQIGIQGTDLILVFRTKTSLENLLRGKITIGAGISAAAGPLGRKASAATDASLTAEILSYSRSRGLFAGVSLDGSSLTVDSMSNAMYYQAGNPQHVGPAAFQPGTLPPSAMRLLTEIARYTLTAAPVAATPVPMAPYPPVTSAAPVMASTPTPTPAPSPDLRRQLAASSTQLGGLLDDHWKRYLALPAEVYSGERPPNAELVRMTVDRFNTVANDARYRELAQRPEFQNTLQLLRQYAATFSASAGSPAVGLPPPPR